MCACVGLYSLVLVCVRLYWFVCACVGLCALVCGCMRLCWFVCACIGLCALVLVCVRLCCFALSAVVCACISLCALVLFCVRLCLLMFTNNINIRFVFGCMRFVCVLQVLHGSFTEFSLVIVSRARFISAGW